MTTRTGTALLALGSGIALAVAFILVVLRVTNDMRWLLLLGSAWLFGFGLWAGGRRRGGVVAFLLLCLPLILVFGLLALPELPGLWPHLPLWLCFSLLGWWGFRSGDRTSPTVIGTVLAVSLLASWYAFAVVPDAISGSLNRPVDQPAPAFTLERLDGSPYAMDTLDDKVVVLDFFATWCAPCIAELPEMDAIYRRYATHSDVEVLVVANLSGGDTPEKIRAFVEGRGLDVPFVLDTDATAHRAFGFAGLPGLVIIDRADRVRFLREGYNAAETGFQETVVELIEDLRSGTG